jgi:hypothetical protein
MLSRAPEPVQTLEKYVKMAKRELRFTFRGNAKGAEAYHRHCAVVLVAKERKREDVAQRVGRVSRVLCQLTQMLRTA